MRTRKGWVAPAVAPAVAPKGFEGANGSAETWSNITKEECNDSCVELFDDLGLTLESSHIDSAGKCHCVSSSGVVKVIGRRRFRGAGAQRGRRARIGRGRVPSRGVASINASISGRRAGYVGADGMPKETGIKPVDTAISKTLTFEKSYLGNPIIQFAILGLAVYGTYTLVTRIAKK